MFDFRCNPYSRKKSVECAHSSVSVSLGRFDTKISQIFSYLSFMLSQSTPHMLFLLQNLSLFLIITGLRHLPKQHVCLQFSFSFLEAYLTLHLTLYLCSSHIQFDIFSLIIFNSKRSRLHLLILYHNKCERIKTSNLLDVGTPANYCGFI